MLTSTIIHNAIISALKLLDIEELRLRHFLHAAGYHLNSNVVHISGDDGEEFGRAASRRLAFLRQCGIHEYIC